MRVIDLSDIERAIDEGAVTSALERGFIALSEGRAQLAAVGHLTFADPPGDGHVKSGHLAGDAVFVVKLATSFYDNPRRGLPSGEGFNAVVSARTGRVLAILHDCGRLTDVRTHLTGALAARAIARAGAHTIGVVGAGVQAQGLARSTARMLGARRILLHGRDAGRAASAARAVGAEAVALDALCAEADLILTATPSTSPLIAAEQLRAGARIVAVGADAPGKRELDPTILAGARVVVDSVAQCVDHGEAGWAVRAGLLDAADLLELGAVLRDRTAFAEDETVVVDLTGVAIQDVQIALSVWRACGGTDDEA